MKIPLPIIEDHLGPQLTTFDPYDFWKTRVGLKVKEIYYSRGGIAIPLVVPFFLLNQYTPRFLRLFIKPQEYPIVRAFAVLSALNLYNKLKDEKYLKQANESVTWLISNKLEGFHGACWGLNMPWMTKTGYVSPTTPFITSTPYCVEALLRYHDLTDDALSRDVAISSLNFLENDLKILYEESGKLAISYGPSSSKNIVINASSYAMMMYSLLGTRIPEIRDKLFEKANKIRKFVLESQNSNGSWWYYYHIEKGNFIDCFHSCFVIKNLIKTDKLLSTNSNEFVEKGIEYLISSHLDKDKFLAKRFSVAAYPNLIKYDLYDQAELMNVFICAEKWELARKIHDSIVTNFYIPDRKTFGSEIDFLGRLNKMKYLRWAVMPTIYVFSEYYKQLAQGEV